MSTKYVYYNVRPKKVKKVKSNPTTDKIFTYPDGTKHYAVCYCISYDESYYTDDIYYADNINNLSHRCFKYEYTDIIASSTENAVRIAKEIIPARLTENAPYNFYRDKKNVKLDSIKEVYVQTIRCDREFVG